MTAGDEFAIRYYRWAIDDARREVREDFSLLRTVKDSLALRAVAYLESFPTHRRSDVAMALVKRFHRKAVALTGDSWGAEEERIELEYREAVRLPRPEEEWHRQAMLHDPGKLEIDRSRFLATIRANLAAESTSSHTAT